MFGVEDGSLGDFCFPGDRNLTVPGHMVCPKIRYTSSQSCHSDQFEPQLKLTSRGGAPPSVDISISCASIRVLLLQSTR